ncbi:MAG: hypothetical protein IT561_20030 [Alphaproteobacteria bacterium]|nr:hypothetical protein [Alphaproteobacteria bacterium]
MSYGFGEDRRRRRGRSRVLRGLVGLALLAVLLGVAFYFGGEHAAGEIEALNGRIVELTETSDRLAKTKGEVEAALTQARTSYQQLEQRYAREVPKGPAADVHKLVQLKLEQGVTAARISAVIALLEAKRVCEGAENRRFYVKVPLYRGGATEATFGGGLLRVGAEGEAATGRNDAPQSFYDPDKPVRVTMTAGDGERQVQGGLPMEESVIGAGFEWRVRLAKGARGFINATVDRCKFP